MWDLFNKLLKLISDDVIARIKPWPLWRKICTLLLLVLLIFAAVAHQELAQSYTHCRRLVMAAANPDAVPLRGQERERLQTAIALLGKFLYAEYHQKKELPIASDRALTGWDTGQIAVALDGLNLPLAAPIDREEINKVLLKTRTEACACWQEPTQDPSNPPHIGATAWATLGFARLGKPAPTATLDFLLASQMQVEGSWPVYPTQVDTFGSTYATAWALLALHHHLNSGLLPPEMESRVREAIQRGTAWLHKTNGSGLWAYYPKANRDRTSLSNSGLILHALHQVEPDLDFKRLDSAWLDQLPRALPGPTDHESWNDWVPTDLGRRKETVRSLLLPWILIATVDAYPNGGIRQRARALALVEAILADAESWVSKVEWHFIAAELLISLRHLREGHLDTRQRVQQPQS